MSPFCEAPISTTANVGSADNLARVKGTPSSLFWLPKVATVAPASPQIDSRKDFAVVLPALPVIPITEPWNRPLMSCPSCADLLRISGLNVWAETSIGRVQAMATAPLSNALSIKSCPSTCSPSIATKRSPGFTARLSIARPVTTASSVSQATPKLWAIQRDEAQSWPPPALEAASAAQLTSEKSSLFFQPAGSSLSLTRNQNSVARSRIQTACE